MLDKNSVAITTCDCYRPEAVSAALDEMFSALSADPAEPFKGMIEPGMRVFIKPNWVASRWRESCDHRDDLYCVITHPAVIEAVADRVARSLKGKGEIIIGDNPSIDADFNELTEHTGILRLENKYDISCRIMDMRPLVCPSLDVYGKKDKMVKKCGDPEGTVKINLGKNSMLYSVDSSLFRGVFDEREETVAAHTGENQLYSFSASLYNSDFYISVPKLKTHQKVGVTLNLKGLVGAVSQKNELVHWRVGTPETGGDEYPDRESYDKAYRSGILHRGSWPGNDTIWRMVVDLYHAFANDGKRKCFTVIDGIMGGEGQGPFCTTAKYSSSLIGGEDLLVTDIVAARYMGFEPAKIKYLEYFIKERKLCPDSDIHVFIDGEQIYDFFSANTRYKDFYVMPLWEQIKYKI